MGAIGALLVPVNYCPEIIPKQTPGSLLEGLDMVIGISEGNIMLSITRSLTYPP